MNLQPATKKTLAESVIECLAGQIYRGEAVPGTALPSERELCIMLKVGRTTVREALRALEILHLVEVRPGRGAFVVSAPNGTVADLVPMGVALERRSRLHLAEARRVIEVEVAALAAARAAKGNVQALGEILQEMVDAASHHRLDDEVAAHAHFHTLIGEMAANPVLTNVVATVVRLLPATTAGHVLVPGASERANEIHRWICECIEAGDADGARKAMTAHMAHEENVIAQAYGTREASSQAVGG